MKTMNDLRKQPRLRIVREEQDGGWAVAVLAISKKQQEATIVFSWGGGWEHVSASFSNRCPTWDEMCEVKRMFFFEDECVVQYHPRQSEYVNVFPYCLHLWRPIDADFPQPPAWMVGPKKGQSLANAYSKGDNALGGMA